MVTKVHFHTPGKLADLLAMVITGVAGGGKPRWRKVIGPVEQLPTWRYIRSNRRIAPRGDADERTVVKQAAAIVRAEHPYIESQRERALRS